MDELVKRVADKAGLSEDMARSAVTVVMNFLNEKLPASIASQVQSALSGGASGTLGDIAGKASSLFNK